MGNSIHSLARAAPSRSVAMSFRHSRWIGPTPSWECRSLTLGLTGVSHAARARYGAWNNDSETAGRTSLSDCPPRGLHHQWGEAIAAPEQGSIKVGHLANMSILNADLFKVPNDEIQDVPNESRCCSKGKSSVELSPGGCGQRLRRESASRVEWRRAKPVSGGAPASAQAAEVASKPRGTLRACRRREFEPKVRIASACGSNSFDFAKGVRIDPLRDLGGMDLGRDGGQGRNRTTDTRIFSPALGLLLRP